MDATIVVVGDEILSGHVQDANGYYIATRLAATGHRLRRITVVSDEPERIVGALRADLDEIAPKIVFVCGGLGPTHDDRTMEAVALALGVGLEPCPPIAAHVRMVVERLAAEGFDGDPLGVAGLEKMALAPAGAVFLECGAALMPAVTIDHGSARVVVLPGPPRELRMVFEESVEPRFLRDSGTPVTRLEIQHPFPESSLAAALIDVAGRYPAVALGSYPREDGVVIRLTGPEGDVVAAADEVRAAIAVLEGSEEGQRLLAYLRVRRANAT